MEVFEPITFYFRHNGKSFEVKAIPYDESDGQNIPLRFLIIIGLTPRGEIVRESEKWESTDINDKPLLSAIANNIRKYYK